MSPALEDLRAQARLAEARLAEAEAAEQRRAVEAAAAALAAVGGAVPPVWFERPRRAKKGEPGGRDPYFHRAQWDWDAEVEAGFDGWIKGNEKGMVLIHFPSAVLWFEGKLKAAQAARRQAREEAA